MNILEFKKVAGPAHLQEKIDPEKDLEFGMIRDEARGLFIPQGNVKAFPEESKSVDIYADPSSKPDDQRRALGEVKDAMESFLGTQPLQEHLNRGLRTGIQQYMNAGTPRRSRPGAGRSRPPGADLRGCWDGVGEVEAQP